MTVKITSGPGRRLKGLRGSPFFVLVVLAISSVPILRAQSIPFNGPRDYLVGTGPQSLVVADFNGDGLRTSLQQITTRTIFRFSFRTMMGLSSRQPTTRLAMDHFLGVLLGNGDGTFQAQKVTPLPGSPQYYLAVGDFNGDGKADVAFTEQLRHVGTWGVLVMLGNGDPTVAAGQPATYTLAIGGGGVSGTASLTCTGAPKGASCNPPATVNVNGASASTFTVSVTTTSRTLAAARSGGPISPGWWAIAMFGFVILPTAARRGRRALRLLPLVLLFVCSCGGNSGGAQSNPNGTPAGSYTLTLSANSGSTSQSMPLTLKVQ